MPTSIPYDPRLVLGNLVNKDAMANLIKIAKVQSPVNAAENRLNSLISSRRGLDMTKNELANLDIETDEIEGQLETLNTQIKDAAKTFAGEKMGVEAKLTQLRSEMGEVDSAHESPIDYVKSKIMSLPLAADSINMNVQYFSFDSNSQSSEAFARQVSGFVSKQTKFLGTTSQVQVAAAASKQANSQASNHSLRGTLVLSVSCTHKNASVIAPFILNVDKAIKVWNAEFPDKKFDPTKPEDILSAAKGGETEDEKLTILSGTTYGSTFVGMVHILNETTTQATESLTSSAVSLQKQMEAGAWFASQSGGFGVNATFGSNVKNLLSTQNISSHVTMICMGAIPSMVANDVRLGVEKFAKFDPQANMEAIAAISGSTSGDMDSVKASATSARTGGQMVDMKTSEIKASLSALAEIDDGNNKILDINSMMTAFDDYLKKAADGTSGVPLMYYLKDINRVTLAEMWVAKYYPGRFLPIISDDSTPPANPAVAAAA